MRKCAKCSENIEAKEAELWQEMIDSLMNFTQTSTALMKGMQNKLGVPPDLDPDKKMCDPCGILKQIKEELDDLEIEEEVPNRCNCTESQTLDDYDLDAEITPGIECHKPPKVIKKKKFKYSSEIESKLLARKKPVPRCQCNKQSYKLSVDACLCKILPEGIDLRDRCDENFCPIKVCSDISGEEIENITCLGEIPEEMVGDKKKEENPLAWIPIPGTFDPDKLPQDDNHPYVIKTQDDFQMEKNSLGYELLRAMRKYGDNIAQINDSTGELEPYSEYAKKCVQVAMKLRREFSKNDIIAICTHKHRNAYIPYIAGLLNGNRVVAFDRTAEKKQMVNCLENVTPAIMFISDNCLTFLQECMQAAKVDFKIVLFSDSDDVGLTSFESYLVDDGTYMNDFEAENTDNVDSTCLICFSGGIPEYKAVCLSHYGILRQSYRMISTQHTQPVTLSFLENFQILSLLVLFSSILDGATRVIVGQFEEEDLWKLVQKYEINSVHLFPHHLAELSNRPEPEEDTSSLIYIFTSGEKVRPLELEILKKFLLKTLICQTYEHTELSGFITIFDFSKPEDSIFNYFVNQSCGKPIDGIWYKVLGVKSRKMVHHLTPGELFIKSKLVRNAYLIKNKEEFPSEDGWISTGDVVTYDTYKCFQFVDRIRDLIKYKKTIIMPSKLEDILLSHPMVTAALVFPVANEQDGQHAAAVVTVKENEDIYTKDLEEWINAKVPEEERLKGGVKIVGSFPYLGNGRINRTALYEMNLETYNNYIN
ncbi:luciferin 4-monooxygenase-like [Coccinella septempunctata]|uniref:luciferin 4-monooxygenase-like n=1 Tax=Coccinella septempunctata TaxID=41139 RepID=UPI001D089093|nr:luciferin 4-monooxygenase-like [Coccinella septempunctata]